MGFLILAGTLYLEGSLNQSAVVVHFVESAKEVSL
jgi:hypothetical protein